MKKYVTFIKSKDESQRVQSALFSAGFEWCTNDKVYLKSVNTFLVINDTKGEFFRRAPIEIFKVGGGGQVCGEGYDAAICKIADLSFIDVEDIIADPFQLDGATQPEKMIEVDGKEYSASTIKAALQEYVK